MKLINNFSEVKPDIDEILEKNRLDIMSLIKKIIISFEFNETHINNLYAFIEYLPEELSVLFFKLIVTKRVNDYDKAIQYFSAFDKVSNKIVEIMMAQ